MSAKKAKQIDVSQINLSDDQAQHFEVEEGSNYKVIMKYGREDVISFEHFLATMKSLFQGTATWTTINKRVLQIEDIRMFEPTDEKNPSQLSAEENARRQRAKWVLQEERKEALKLQFSNFQVNFFDFKFGSRSEWSFLQNKPGMHHITQEDREESITEFKSQFPAEYRELKELELL